MSADSRFSRRDFMKLSGLGLGALALGSPRSPVARSLWQVEFPQSERLGRVVEELGTFINVRTRPSSDAPEAGRLAGDEVVPWLREVVGYTPYRNQRWVETPQGYVWAPLLQPVRNLPNTPLDTLPQTGSETGMWMEVTVPYVEAQLANANPLGFRIRFLVENSLPIRFYYGQVWWVDDIRSGERGVEYRWRDPTGSGGGHFWVPAQGLKPIFPEDIPPLSPEIENKRIVINIARQTMSCFEDEREVYFCRVSTGRFGEDTQTPVSDNLKIFMKFVSTHMEGGATGAGYDLSGIGWSTFIAAGGIAVHSTYWHNNFGERTSAGCVNVRPEDARFIFRWSAPEVSYYPGKQDQIAGSLVRVVES